MSYPRDRFQLASDRDLSASVARRAWFATCGTCGERGAVTDSSKAGLPPDIVAKKLQQRGWLIGSRPEKDRCPACCARPKTPAQPKEEPMALRADPPPTPTPADRRRILDAIEERWVEAKNCYAKNWTDQAIAAVLNVPRAWVSEVREQMFGPEQNETADLLKEAFGEVKALVDQANQKATEACALAEQAEKRLQRLERELGYQPKVA